MKVYVKRENWDGGIWFSLPASQESKKELMQELAIHHPSAMLPFAGGIDCMEEGLGYRLGRCLAGETLFLRDHFELWNRLAEAVDALTREERVVLEAALRQEQPDSIEKVMETLAHRQCYTLHPDIGTYEALGRYAVGQLKMEIPEEFSRYIDYPLIGNVWENYLGCLTEEGFVEKKKTEKPEYKQTERGDKEDTVFGIRIPKKNKPGRYLLFSLPVDAQKMEELRLESGYEHLEEMSEMEVVSQFYCLYEYLPPGSTLGELNQAAKEVQSLQGKGTVDRRTLLAALEAEVPESMEEACQVIRNYADYEILPVKSLEPESYAKYILGKKMIKIREELEPFFRYDILGKEFMERDGPVETSHGVLINKARAIPEMAQDSKAIRWYSPLTISCYNGEEGTFPEILSGEKAVPLRERIHKIVRESMEDYGESGLAGCLSNRLLQRKVVSMQPDVVEYAQDLFCVLDIQTRGKLNEREYHALREEWKEMMALGWGRQLFESPMDFQGDDAFLGFWDEENGKELFVRTEEEMGNEPPAMELKL